MDGRHNEKISDILSGIYIQLQKKKENLTSLPFEELIDEVSKLIYEEYLDLDLDQKRTDPEAQAWKQIHKDNNTHTSEYLYATALALAIYTPPKDLKAIADLENSLKKIETHKEKLPQNVNGAIDELKIKIAQDKKINTPDTPSITPEKERKPAASKAKPSIFAKAQRRLNSWLKKKETPQSDTKKTTLQDAYKREIQKHSERTKAYEEVFTSLSQLKEITDERDVKKLNTLIAGTKFEIGFGQTLLADELFLKQSIPDKKQIRDLKDSLTRINNEAQKWLPEEKNLEKQTTKQEKIAKKVKQKIVKKTIKLLRKKIRNIKEYEQYFSEKITNKDILRRNLKGLEDALATSDNPILQPFSNLIAGLLSTKQLTKDLDITATANKIVAIFFRPGNELFGTDRLDKKKLAEDLGKNIKAATLEEKGDFRHIDSDKNQVMQSNITTIANTIHGLNQYVAALKNADKVTALKDDRLSGIKSILGEALENVRTRSGSARPESKAEKVVPRPQTHPTVPLRPRSANTQSDAATKKEAQEERILEKVTKILRDQNKTLRAHNKKLPKIDELTKENIKFSSALRSIIKTLKDPNSPKITKEENADYIAKLIADFFIEKNTGNFLIHQETYTSEEIKNKLSENISNRLNEEIDGNEQIVADSMAKLNDSIEVISKQISKLNASMLKEGFGNRIQKQEEKDESKYKELKQTEIKQETNSPSNSTPLIERLNLIIENLKTISTEYLKIKPDPEQVETAATLTLKMNTQAELLKTVRVDYRNADEPSENTDKHLADADRLLALINNSMHTTLTGMARSISSTANTQAATALKKNAAEAKESETIINNLAEKYTKLKQINGNKPEQPNTILNSMLEKTRQSLDSAKEEINKRKRTLINEFQQRTDSISSDIKKILDSKIFADIDQNNNTAVAAAAKIASQIEPLKNRLNEENKFISDFSHYLNNEPQEKQGQINDDFRRLEDISKKCAKGQANSEEKEKEKQKHRKDPEKSQKEEKQKDTRVLAEHQKKQDEPNGEMIILNRINTLIEVQRKLQDSLKTNIPLNEQILIDQPRDLASLTLLNNNEASTLSTCAIELSEIHKQARELNVHESKRIADRLNTSQDFLANDILTLIKPITTELRKHQLIFHKELNVIEIAKKLNTSLQPIQVLNEILKKIETAHMNTPKHQKENNNDSAIIQMIQFAKENANKMEILISKLNKGLIKKVDRIVNHTERDIKEYTSAIKTHWKNTPNLTIAAVEALNKSVNAGINTCDEGITIIASYDKLRPEQGNEYSPTLEQAKRTLNSFKDNFEKFSSIAQANELVKTLQNKPIEAKSNFRLIQQTFEQLNNFKKSDESHAPDYNSAQKKLLDAFVNATSENVNAVQFEAKAKIEVPKDISAKEHAEQLADGLLGPLKETIGYVKARLSADSMAPEAFEFDFNLQRKKAMLTDQIYKHILHMQSESNKAKVDEVKSTGPETKESIEQHSTGILTGTDIETNMNELQDEAHADTLEEIAEIMERIDEKYTKAADKVLSSTKIIPETHYTQIFKTEEIDTLAHIRKFSNTEWEDVKERIFQARELITEKVESLHTLHDLKNITTTIESKASKALEHIYDMDREVSHKEAANYLELFDLEKNKLETLDTTQPEKIANEIKQEAMALIESKRALISGGLARIADINAINSIRNGILSHEQSCLEKIAIEEKAEIMARTYLNEFDIASSLLNKILPEDNYAVNLLNAAKLEVKDLRENIASIINDNNNALEKINEAKEEVMHIERKFLEVMGNKGNTEEADPKIFSDPINILTNLHKEYPNITRACPAKKSIEKEALSINETITQLNKAVKKHNKDLKIIANVKSTASEKAKNIRDEISKNEQPTALDLKKERDILAEIRKSLPTYDNTVNNALAEAESFLNKLGSSELVTLIYQQTATLANAEIKPEHKDQSEHLTLPLNSTSREVARLQALNSTKPTPTDLTRAIDVYNHVYNSRFVENKILKVTSNTAVRDASEPSGIKPAPDGTRTAVDIENYAKNYIDNILKEQHPKRNWPETRDQTLTENAERSLNSTVNSQIANVAIAIATDNIKNKITDNFEEKANQLAQEIKDEKAIILEGRSINSFIKNYFYDTFRGLKDMHDMSAKRDNRLATPLENAEYRFNVVREKLADKLLIANIHNCAMQLANSAAGINGELLPYAIKQSEEKFNALISGFETKIEDHPALKEATDIYKLVSIYRSNENKLHKMNPTEIANNLSILPANNVQAISDFATTVLMPLQNELRDNKGVLTIRADRDFPDNRAYSKREEVYNSKFEEIKTAVAKQKIDLITQQFVAIANNVIINLHREPGMISSDRFKDLFKTQHQDLTVLRGLNKNDALSENLKLALETFHDKKNELLKAIEEHNKAFTYNSAIDKIYEIAENLAKTVPVLTNLSAELKQDKQLIIDLIAAHPILETEERGKNALAMYRYVEARKKAEETLLLDENFEQKYIEAKNNIDNNSNFFPNEQAALTFAHDHYNKKIEQFYLDLATIPLTAEGLQLAELVDISLVKTLDTKFNDFKDTIITLQAMMNTTQDFLRKAITHAENIGQKRNIISIAPNEDLMLLISQNKTILDNFAITANKNTFLLTDFNTLSKLIDAQANQLQAKLNLHNEVCNALDLIEEIITQGIKSIKTSLAAAVSKDKILDLDCAILFEKELLLLTDLKQKIHNKNEPALELRISEIEKLITDSRLSIANDIKDTKKRIDFPEEKAFPLLLSDGDGGKLRRAWIQTITINSPQDSDANILAHPNLDKNRVPAVSLKIDPAGNTPYTDQDMRAAGVAIYLDFFRKAPNINISMNFASGQIADMRTGPCDVRMLDQAIECCLNVGRAFKLTKDLIVDLGKNVEIDFSNYFTSTGERKPSSEILQIIKSDHNDIEKSEPFKLFENILKKEDILIKAIKANEALKAATEVKQNSTPPKNLSQIRAANREAQFNLTQERTQAKLALNEHLNGQKGLLNTSSGSNAYEKQLRDLASNVEKYHKENKMTSFGFNPTDFSVPRGQLSVNPSPVLTSSPSTADPTQIDSNMPGNNVNKGKDDPEATDHNDIHLNF